MEKSFGFILKEARANKHIGLEEASKHTRIHINILKAIENDDVASLGAVYVKSFLRLYADYLGVDKDDVLRRFRQATGQSEAGDINKLASSEHYPTRKLRQNIVLLNNYKIFIKIFIVVVLVFIAIALIVKFAKRHSVKPRAAQVVAQRAVKKAVVKRPAPVSILVPVPVKKVVPVELPVVFQPADKLVAVKKEPIFIAPSAKIQKNIILVIRAKEKCWLQVKVDGKEIFKNVLAKGSSESWQAYEKIELWLGNAGAVQLELNGKLLQKIGRPGQTLRHVVVTRAGLSIRG